RSVPIRRERRVDVLSLLVRDWDLEGVLLRVVGVEREPQTRDLVRHGTRRTDVVFRLPRLTAEHVVLVRLLLDTDRREEDVADHTIVRPRDGDIREDLIDVRAARSSRCVDRHYGINLPAGVRSTSISSPSAAAACSAIPATRWVVTAVWALPTAV